MTTIDLPLQSATGPAIVVKAEIVYVAPHLAHVATFAVHEVPKNTCSREIYCNRYRISNVETGACISQCDSITKAGCIKLARACLSSFTEASPLEAMKLSMRKIK